MSSMLEASLLELTVELMLTVSALPPERQQKTVLRIRGNSSRVSDTVAS